MYHIFVCNLYSDRLFNIVTMTKKHLVKLNCWRGAFVEVLKYISGTSVQIVCRRMCICICAYSNQITFLFYQWPKSPPHLPLRVILFYIYFFLMLLVLLILIFLFVYVLVYCMWSSFHIRMFDLQIDSTPHL